MNPLTPVRSPKTRRKKPWESEAYEVPPTPPRGAFSNGRRASTHYPPGPLVSDAVMNIGTQRLVAVSFFVAIQAWKHYAVWATDMCTIEHTIKFMFVDACYIWILQVMRIPWLTFNTYVSLIATAFLCIYNVLLTSNELSIVAICLGLWKSLFTSELSLSGTKLRPKDVTVDARSHLSAKYIVNILPESTVQLNPLNSAYCMDINDNSTFVRIPVILNATEPNLLQLQRTDFISGEKALLNFTKFDLKKLRVPTPDLSALRRASGTTSSSSSGSGLDKKSLTSLSAVALPVAVPGYYEVVHAVDSSGMLVRVLRSHAFVVQCPKAYINIPADYNPDKCLGDTDVPDIIVTGTPPLNVQYSRWVDGKRSSFSLDSVQPEHFARQSGVLDWAKPQNIALALDPAATSVGLWTYSVEKVVDSLGNVVDYTKTDIDGSKGKLKHEFTVHDRPTARFLDCDALKATKLARGGEVDLSLQVQGHVNRILVEREINDDSLKEEFEIAVAVGSGVHRSSIRVSKPGLYRIKKVDGRFCEGDIMEPSSCLVYVPPEPTVDIEFQQISDKCVGSTGARANITLTGTPPFWLTYKWIKDGKEELRTYQTGKTRDIIEFAPQSAGKYKYEFVSLSDSLYKNQPLVATGENKLYMEQTVHVRAGARFRGPSARRCCSGDSVNVDVQLQGIPPLDLEYEIVDPNGRRKHFVDTAIESLDGHSIRTPNLQLGGKYTVTLLSVQDSRQCKTILREDNAYVDVRRQRPTAGFVTVNGNSRIQTLEQGVVNIPVKLSGEAPWIVAYDFIDETRDGLRTSHKARFDKSNGGTIRVNGRGKYILTSVHDASCPGAIAGLSEFEVDWISKPTLTLADGNRTMKDICEGSDGTLEFALSGTPPFDVYYDVIGPHSSLSQKLHVAAKHGALKLETAKPGIYTYKITAVGDSRYDQRAGILTSPIVVRQKVNSKPSAAITSRNKVFRKCFGQGVSTDNDITSSSPSFRGVPIQLKGKAPFVLTVAIRHESTGKTSTHTVHATDAQFLLGDVDKMFTNLALGRHLISLTKIKDATECERYLDNGSDGTTNVAASIATIVVSDAPRLSSLADKNDFCIGDKLAFTLNGVAPFEIMYEFNGKPQRAESASPFSRVATVPGNLTFISIADGASNCVTDLHNMPSVIVHDLPSVSMSGDTNRRDIHEGDETNLTFLFSGTPPFSFTYTRSEYENGRVRPVETHTVENINGYSYTVSVSSQGEYEVVALEDKYCVVDGR